MKSYFQLRISDKYRYFWKKVLSESIKVKPCPIFYQYIVDHILEQLVKIHFPVGLGERNEHPIPQLDFQEMSALQVCCGSSHSPIKLRDPLIPSRRSFYSV